jgi:hypothetical protein
LRLHIVRAHGEEEFRKVILAEERRGTPDEEIGQRYGVSFGTIQQLVTETYGANVSSLRARKRIKRWQPAHFREETTTVWSFRQRGDWATHDGRYRGNWSPYIPRNVILKYSKPGEVVLDYFVDGGTTAVEAKLLGRRCVARDINPSAISMTIENLNFSVPPSFFGEALPHMFEPQVSVGDARALSDIRDATIDLVCAHPPYAGIIQYSTRIPGDLSMLSIGEFLTEMRKVAMESMRVLKPGGKCAILIGDARKDRRVVPIGFSTIGVFLEAGFGLRELVIKRQHNCKTTGFWYTRSIQHNFLLLAHEYLPIFEKPPAKRVAEQGSLWADIPARWRADVTEVPKIGDENLETTTVWIFPEERIESETRRNLLRRFGMAGGAFSEVVCDGGRDAGLPESHERIGVLYVDHASQQDLSAFGRYRAALRNIVTQSRQALAPGSCLVIRARDFRAANRLVPAGFLVWKDMDQRQDFRLREIIIVAPEQAERAEGGEQLSIVHSYLLVYEKTDTE